MKRCRRDRLGGCGEDRREEDGEAPYKRIVPWDLTFLGNLYIWSNTGRDEFWTVSTRQDQFHFRTGG